MAEPKKSNPNLQPGEYLGYNPDVFQSPEDVQELAQLVEQKQASLENLPGPNEPLSPEEPQAQSSIAEKAKTVGYLILGIAVFGLLAAIAMAFIYGILWISAKLYPIVVILSVLGLIALVVNLLPSAIFKGSRRVCGNGIVIVSYVWGLALWMYATLILYQLWGGVGMFFGFALMGVGSIPLACVAMLFAREWALIGEVLLSVVIIFATRALGHWVISKGQESLSAASGWE